MITATACPICGHKDAEHHVCSPCPQCGGPKSLSALRCYTCAWPGRPPRSTRQSAPPEPVMPAFPTKRVQIRYRVYCVSCGRATDVEVASRYAPRCQVCGGTMLLEPSE